MVIPSLPISLIIAHFVGDFLLQSNWMALNKSKSWLALTAHCFVYSVFVGAWAASYVSGQSVYYNSPLWVPFIFVPHFITDAITSRITSKLWFINLEPILVVFENEPKYTHYASVKATRHWFFVMIGLDQLIHYATLAYTIRLLA